MKTDSNRESARRQHRVLGHYMSIQAWIRQLDCIVLIRKDLEAFLGLKRFKGSRISWLREDLKPWFPYQKPYFKTSAMSSISSLFLSRVPISTHLALGSMTTDQRIERMVQDAPKTEKFIKLGSPWAPPTQQDMVSQLAVISSGLAVPQDYRARRKVKS